MVILASYQDKLGDVVKLLVSCSGQGDGDFLASFRVVHLNHRAPAVVHISIASMRDNCNLSRVVAGGRNGQMSPRMRGSGR